MNESQKSMFVIGGPGSGKDYVINNILSRFNLIEVQLDQILNGFAKNLIEAKANLLVNGNADMDKIKLVKDILEGYDFSHTIVSVTNKVSRLRNESRKRPLNEQTRIRKWLDAEKISTNLTNTFVFDNTLDLSKATQLELAEFQNQIASYLAFIVENNFTAEEYVMIHAPEHKSVHGKKARVFYRHTDGRVNVQLNMGYSKNTKTGERERKVHNYTLAKHQYKPVAEALDLDRTVDPQATAYGEGTPRSAQHAVKATPGQGINTKPKLSLRKFRKGLMVPPTNVNARIDGAGGYSLGPAGAGSGMAGVYTTQ